MARDVEERHADLYKNALQAMTEEVDVTYHVCQICGYVFDASPPDTCPVCKAARNQFKKIA